MNTIDLLYLVLIVLGLAVITACAGWRDSHLTVKRQRRTIAALRQSLANSRTPEAIDEAYAALCERTGANTNLPFNVTDAQLERNIEQAILAAIDAGETGGMILVDDAGHVELQPYPPKLKSVPPLPDADASIPYFGD